MSEPRVLSRFYGSSIRVIRVIHDNSRFRQLTPTLRNQILNLNKTLPLRQFTFPLTFHSRFWYPFIGFIQYDYSIHTS